MRRNKKKAFLIFFTSACRRRLFRKLYSGLYSSTDNRRSGKAGLQSVSLSLLYWSLVRGNFFCHLLSCLRIPTAHSLSFFLVFLTWLTVTHVHTHTCSEPVNLPRVSAISRSPRCLLFLCFCHTNTSETDKHTHTYLYRHTLLHLLSRALSPSCPVKTVRHSREASVGRNTSKRCSRSIHCILIQTLDCDLDFYCYFL